MSLSVRSKTVAIAAGIVAAAGSVWLYRSVSKYGIKGTLRYIWEGDAYPPEVRKSLNQLEKVEQSIEREYILNRLEESLARAKLDSIDDVTIEPQWIIAHAPRDLEKDLSKISHDLDTLAAKVDAVPSHGDADIKVRKKRASQQLVLMMERADYMLEVYAQKDNL